MSPGARRYASIAMVVLGAALLLVGGFALYARVELYDADRFSRTAADTVREEPVRDALAEPIVNQIVDVGPDELINAQPLLQSAVSGALETGAFKGIFRQGVEKAHRALFAKDRDELVLTVQDVNDLIVGAIGAASPGVAKKIPDDVGRRIVRITDSKPALAAARFGDDVRFLGLVLPPLGILLLGGGVLLAADRRRMAITGCIAVGTAAAVGFVALLVSRTLLLRKFDDETTHDAVAAVFDAYAAGLTRWLLLGGVVAIALGAAMAAGDPKPLQRLRNAIAAVTRTPQGKLARAGRAVAIGLAGAFAFWEPTLALQIVAVLAGAVAIYYAVIELTATLAPEAGEGTDRVTAAGSSSQGLSSWRVPAIAAGMIVAGAVAIGFLITNERRREASRPEGPVKVCNGYAELCDRALDQVTFPTTHNAMGAAQLPGWFTPNQRLPIERQLEDGVRGFQIDTHPGIKRPSGPVLTDFEGEDRSKVIEEIEAQMGPEAVASFQRVTRRFAGQEGERGVYLCHVVCELGSTKFEQALGWFREFLDTHPDEVIVLFIEDAVSPEETREVFEASGILRYAYVRRPGRPFPTMRSLIESDKRLFVMAETDNGGGTITWYHDGFALTQETPFTFNSPPELNPPASCVLNRGLPSSPLFQINHWVEQIPRSPATAAKVNAFGVLNGRVAACAAQRGLQPNIVAVDFYERGDLIEVARVQNGLDRNALPSYRRTDAG